MEPTSDVTARGTCATCKWFNGKRCLEAWPVIPIREPDDYCGEHAPKEPK